MILFGLFDYVVHSPALLGKKSIYFDNAVSILYCLFKQEIMLFVIITNGILQNFFLNFN